MNKTYHRFANPGLVSLVFLLNFNVICFSQIRIAISKTSPNYENWLKTADPAFIPVNMYSLPIDSALKLLSGCNALLLTGGEDVDPVNYGKLNELNKCEDIDRYRDSLEFGLIKKALSLKLPIFGICRGEQILNVALGGTLYTDIPTEIDTLVIHRCPASAQCCMHAVEIGKSLLYAITNQSSGMVNSYHHQAVEKPAPGLIISAFSTNRVPEAIESDGTVVKSFLMGVQWHPERFSQNPSLSLPLAERFITEAKMFKTGQKM